MNRKIFLYIVSGILPFVLLPLALSSNQESKCAYVMLIVAFYFILEPVPIAVTSMLPMVLFPLLGVISSKDVCQNYMKEGYMALIGGLMAAIAVEKSKLHERIALKILLLIGTDFKRLLLGTMLTTALLSMWMTNTAATTLMIPLVNVMAGEIGSDAKEIPHDDSNSSTDSNQIFKLEENGKKRNTIEDVKDKSTTFRLTLLLGVCYAANIGGLGTLMGTGGNMVFVAMFEKFYPDSNNISFASWMMYNVPGVLLCVIIGWFYLWLLNIYFQKIQHSDKSKEEIYGIISKRYKKLGSPSSHEISVIVLFSLLIILWVFRDPKFIPGWYTALSFKLKIGDSTTAIAIIFLMFLLPSDFRNLSSPRVLEWKAAQAEFPWSIIFLIGGGASLAQGAQVSGLSNSIGLMLSKLKGLPPGLIVTIICFSTAATTEIITNMTVVMIFQPILSQLAISIGVNPLYLMLPANSVASYAFMLPVATVPNAIVYEEGNMRIMDMAKPGIGMNIICCCVQLFTLHTLGEALFDLSTFPRWADDRNFTNFESLFINATQIPNKTYSVNL